MFDTGLLRLPVLVAFSWWTVFGCSSGTVEPSDEDTTDRDGSVVDTADQSVRDVSDGELDSAGDAGRLPESRPGRLIAVRAGASEIRFDGQLREPRGRPVAFSDSDGASDNRVEAEALWNDDFLYLGATIEDDEVSRDSTAKPWHNDGIELAVDPDDSGGSRPQGDEMKWIVGPDGTRLVSDRDPGNWVDREPSDQRATTARTDKGWIFELKVPWTVLEVRPDRTPELGFILVNNDRDDGDVRRFSWTGAVDGDFGRPDEWGTLRLFGQDRETGDTGVDAGPRSDTGMPPQPRLGPPRYLSEEDFQFDTVLNAVEDLGMDPTGETAIDEKLEQAHGPHTLIEFPPGTYKIEASPEVNSTRNFTHEWRGVDHFGIKGLGDRPKDVQFVVAKQPANYGGSWIEDMGGSGALYKNFAIQQRDDPHTSAEMKVGKEDLLLMEEVEWAGFTPAENHSTGKLLYPFVTTREGVGELNRIYMRDSAAMPPYPDGPMGVRIGAGHVGTLYLTDLWIENRGSSSFRFTHPSGRVGVEGGFFKNNANTNLRGGAGNHPDGPSYMRGATVVVDSESFNEYQPEDEPLTVTQGLRIDSSGNGWNGLIVEDLDIYFLNAPSSGEGIITRPDYGDHGAATLRDIRIRNDTEIPTTSVKDVSKPSDETIRFENLQVAGTGTGALEAAPSTSAELVDSCVSSNFDIDNYDVVDNISRSDCTPPSAPKAPPERR